MSFSVLGALVSAILYFDDFERPELQSWIVPLPSPHDRVRIQSAVLAPEEAALPLDEYESDLED